MAAQDDDPTTAEERTDESTLGESAPERVRRRHEVADALSERGFGDVLVLSAEAADRALTPARREIVDAIAANDVSSQRALADLLDRDPGNVKRDLAVLVDAGVVGREADGRAYRPYLKHDAVVPEPLPLPRSN